MLKVYFWIVIVFNLIFLVMSPGMTGLGLRGLEFPALALLLTCLFPLLPIYSYSFKKKLFSPRIWKIYLPLVALVIVIWPFIAPLLIPNPTHQYLRPQDFLFLVTLNILLLPGYYSAYRLGFKK